MVRTTNRLALRIVGVAVIALSVLAIVFLSIGPSEYRERQVPSPTGASSFAETKQVSLNEADGFDESQATDGVPDESVAAEAEPNRSALAGDLESESPSVWPAFMEARIQDYLVQYSELGITNIQRVECNESVCEIEIYGTTVEKAEAAGWELFLNVPEEEWHVADLEIRRVEVYPQVEAIIIELYPNVDQAE